MGIFVFYLWEMEYLFSKNRFLGRKKVCGGERTKGQMVKGTVC